MQDEKTMILGHDDGTTRRERHAKQSALAEPVPEYRGDVAERQAIANDRQDATTGSPEFDDVQISVS
mgnify:CR=1 FL=1